MPAIVPGAPCYARIKDRGIRTPWLAARVVGIKPLRVRIEDSHPVWNGAVVGSDEAHIRVDPKRWPVQESAK